MIYLDLFLGFLRVGCFSFGGAYAAIPLIRDVVLSYGWLTEESLTYMIAVSESTPGPIMVNLATYVGSSQAGLSGAALATFAVALPSFVVVLLVMVVLKSLLNDQYVRAVLGGMKPCMAGIILATGSFMTLNNAFGPAVGSPIAWKDVLLTGILAAVMFVPKFILKKKVSPILLIVISAVLGVAAYGI